VTLRVERYPDAASFLEACGPFLAAREAQHCVMLGFALASRDRPRPPAAPDAPAVGAVPGMTMTAVLDGRDPRFVAGVTDKAALLSAIERREDAGPLVAAMVDSLALQARDLPGFEAEPPVAAAFARRWDEASGRPARRVLRERVYRLDRLVPPDPPVPGRARPMGDADVPLVGSWMEAFVREATPHEGPIDGISIAATWPADPWRDVQLWEHGGRPVSMAVAAWPTFAGARVSYVYTPPENRRRGFGSAVTAAVTANQLASGRRACFLYTDLANPTSNAIYRALGYRAVADVDRYLIDRRAGRSA
jgi:ribosomal protein S18 acetylase RimI-like enzyme